MGKKTYDLLIGVVEEKAENMNVREEDPQLIIDRLGLLVHGNVTHALNAYRTDKISSTPPK